MGESYTELMAEAGLLLNRGRLAQALMTCETWRNEGRVSDIDAALVAARVNLDSARPAQALEKILEVSDLDTDHVRSTWFAGFVYSSSFSFRKRSQR